MNYAENAEKEITSEINFAISLMWLVVVPGSIALVTQLLGAEAIWLYYLICLVIGVAVNAVVAENDDYLVIATVSLVLLLSVMVGTSLAEEANSIYLPNDVPVLNSAWTSTRG
jgi:hypothetical protein